MCLVSVLSHMVDIKFGFEDHVPFAKHRMMDVVSIISSQNTLKVATSDN